MIAARDVGVAAIGLAGGVGASWAATRALTGVLYGVPANDPSAFGVVVLLLGAVALVACLVAAARASRVDPMIVLRDQ